MRAARLSPRPQRCLHPRLHPRLHPHPRARATAIAATLLLVGAVPLSGQAQAQAQAQGGAQRVEVVGATPVGDTGIPAQLFPANIQSFPLSRSAASASTQVADLLNREAGSVTLGDTQGNGFQADLNYRGFTASPILGTPQGLSVFIDGMRINEPFGDIVSWDLVPQVALSRVTLVPGTNPVFGLNTLGGALALRTKTGFDFDGSSVDLQAGAFGRRALEAEHGWRDGADAAYLATQLYRERGWAVANPSRVNHLFGALGHHDGATAVDLSLHTVSSYLAGNQLVPESMLANAAQGYSRPDHTATTAAAANLRFSQRLSPTQTLEGNLSLRRIARTILNTNINHPVTPGLADEAGFCADHYGEACAENIETRYTQRVWAANLQIADQRPLAGRRNFFTAGLNLERASTALQQFAQDAIVDAGRVVLGIAPLAQQSAISSSNRRAAAFVTNTLVLAPSLSLTTSLRYDLADVALAGNSVDAGGSAVDVGGRHRYHRLNPALGGTWAPDAALTVFANYAEGMRAPSAIELACADAEHPCAGVPNAFSADPPLQPVVARGFELGARGRVGGGSGGGSGGEAADGLQWRIAAFRTLLRNDIQFNLSSVSTGYFSNVGATRRSGIEFGLSGTSSAWDFGLSTTWQRATFETAFTVANPANADGSVAVRPGDVVPGVPALTAKLRGGWRAPAGTRWEAEWQAQASQFVRGNENNLAGGQVPGFALVRLAATQPLSGQWKAWELYASVSNLFNRQVANYGMRGNNAFVGANGTDENFWGVGQPRGFSVGLRGTL